MSVFRKSSQENVRMGRLRSSIENVVKTAGTLEKAASMLLERRTTETDNFMHATDMCRGGAEVMYMYLMEKYKKEGQKIEDNQKTTLQEVSDSKIATMLREMDANQATVVRLISERDKTQAIGLGVKSNATKLRDDLKTIQGVIDKKKKKWLTSKAYKAKIKGYEDSVNELDASLAQLEGSLPGKSYGKMVNPKNWAFTLSSTVADLKAGMSTYFTADMKLTKTEDDTEAKKFRGRGFAKSLATMRAWADEADAMEAET
jgi:hypothetical protein